LVDGIYPPWVTFVGTISELVGQEKTHFFQRKEGARKDVDRAFGVLQARFAIVRRPAKIWNLETLWEMMTSCVIMHTMTVKDEGEGAAGGLKFANMGDPIELPAKNPVTFEEFVQIHRQIQHRATRQHLKNNDLVEYPWVVKGDN
jgi:hypothetical protein